MTGKLASERELTVHETLKIDHEHIVLVLQGGGALGAYQAGVFEEIAKFPREPHWVAGVSIGAINAALIVGNPPARRVERLREFWDLVSSCSSGIPMWWEGHGSLNHQFHAAVASTFGVEGFYKPRMPPPFLQPEGSDAALSFYDTAPLKATLERLVDFDLINSKKLRLSVGAANVRTGNSVYFDNHFQKIGPEHIMASGALPPAFAPVMIDGEPYWDGGIVSNTPLQYVLDKRDGAKILIAQVDLFSARGAMPTNIGNVMSRHKDIMYSSRTRFNTDKLAQIQRNKKTLLKLIAMLPEAERESDDIKQLAAANQTTHIDIVHLIYRQSRFELESKDYEFSRRSVLEHWESGRRDMHRTIEHPDLLRKSAVDDGVTVYDLAHDHLQPGQGASGRLQTGKPK
ncbi:patatin-like phospholipase family protein [Uliginosibacterium sp. H3]|uniref:Patatin-like phospholipase family protein n=1 Tax=Uliginosibacterium silvisoli TaxID=3114758 RepID=A0ABU6JYR8_9RHOO|nr:patatin-like phospholipase family protein [Uliginosibacterium sp. H3]